MRIYKYSIPFCTPVLPLSRREGLIALSEQSIAEASPLPGFSKETLDEALVDLQQSRPTLPSVQFCQASLGKPFPNAFPSLPLSALVSSKQEAEAAIQQGFRTLKVKVRHLAVQETVRLIASLQSPSYKLRIDANRRWSFEEALYVFEHLDPLGIEYIEEPLADPEGSLRLPSLPIALDETLLERPSGALLQRARAFVLKPTLLGERLSGWLEMAKQQQKTIAFSSSFESVIGLMHTAHLQKMHAPETAIGLDTYHAFEVQPLPFPVREGRICDDDLPLFETKWLQPIH